MPVDEKAKLDQGAGSLSVALAARKLNVERADPKIIVDIVTRLFKKSQEQKEIFWIPRWLQSLYFIMGHMHIFWDQGTTRWFPELLTQDKRITVNMVKPRWLSDAARLTRSKPNFLVVPDRGGADAREDARVGQIVLQDLHRRLRMTRKTQLGALHRAAFGGVYYKAVWNPNAISEPPRPIQATEIDGSPVTDEEGLPVMVVDSRGRPRMDGGSSRGEIEIIMPSVFDMHGPPSAATPFPDEWSWAGENVPMSVGEVRSRYGVTVSPEKKAVDIVGQVQVDLGRFFSRGEEAFGELRSEDTVNVMEYNEPPSNEPGFEMGRRVIVAGKKLIANEPGYLPHSGDARPAGRCPYHCAPFLPTPMMAYADCFIPEMLEPNMAYNSARADLARARSRLRHPHLVMEERTVNEDSITQGGRVLKVKQGRPYPQVMQVPGIDSATVSELRASKEDIDASASQFPPSRGEPLGKSPQAAASIELMQQADASDLSFAITLGADAIAELGTDVLDLARENYDTKRVAQAVGPDGDPEIFEYSKADIAPGLRVEVQQGSELTLIKEGRRGQLSEILKSGMLEPAMGDPNFAAKVYDVWDLPPPNAIGELSNVDMKLQERESREILFGPGEVTAENTMPINDNDHHASHEAEIDSRTKDATWPTVDPTRAQALLAHKQLHTEARQQQEADALKQQMAQALQMAQAQAGIQAEAQIAVAQAQPPKETSSASKK